MGYLRSQPNTISTSVQRTAPATLSSSWWATLFANPPSYALAAVDAGRRTDTFSVFP